MFGNHFRILLTKKVEFNLSFDNGVQCGDRSLGFRSFRSGCSVAGLNDAEARTLDVLQVNGGIAAHLASG